MTAAIDDPGGPARPRPNLDSARCASRHALELIADKWAILVIRALQDGPERYEALRRRIGGVSKPMLTRTLRELENNGLVLRTVSTHVPPRVEYRLTALGDTLRAPMQALAAWAEDHMHAVQAARGRATAGAEERT